MKMAYCLNATTRWGSRPAQTWRRALLVVIACVLLAGVATPSRAAAPSQPTVADDQDEEAFAPLLVMVEFDPWQKRVGPAAPLFALYDNGLLIFSALDKKGQRTFYSTTLAEDDLSTFVAEFAITDAFFSLKAYYLLPIRENQMATIIYVQDAQRGAKWVGVYGNLRKEVSANARARNLAPDAFVTLFDQIAAYSNPDAEVWEPARFEVVLKPVNDAQNPVEWPADWPDLNDPSTVQHKGSFSIYLPIKEAQAFLDLIENADAIEMDGQLFSFNSRLPFPHEAVWQKATENTSFAIGY
jgi:hypothetical protein